jgi:hypothetical protein
MEHTMEKIQQLKAELKEAQFLLDDIYSNQSHPLFDQKHHAHGQVKSAVCQLERRVFDLSTMVIGNRAKNTRRK